MTPEQKAQDLIKKFEPLAHKNFTMRNDGMLEKQIKCALICVEQILEAIIPLEQYDFEPMNEYWREVKTILEKQTK